MADYGQGEIGYDLFRAACGMGLEGIVSKHRGRAYSGGKCNYWIKMLGGDGKGCGILGALSKDTNGAPHVAIFWREQVRHRPRA